MIKKTRTLSFEVKKYTPAICQILLDVYSEGGTMASFCKRVQISKTLFRNWIKNYPEFARSVEIAEILKRVYHEEWLSSNLENKEINPHILKPYLKEICKFVEDNDTSNVTINNTFGDEAVEQIKALKEKYKSEF